MRRLLLLASVLVACSSDEGGTVDNYGSGGALSSGGAAAGGVSGQVGAGGWAGTSSGAGGQAGADAGSAGASAGGVASGGTSAAGGTTADSGPSEPPPLDLAQVKWLHTNVSSWPVTVSLKGVSVSGGQVCMDHDIASKGWPIKTISGTEVVANPWVFIHQGGQWYGATWEWLRPPGQTCKAQTSVAGDHIKVAPFDAASGWTPSKGQTLYFMVSGLARGGLSNVQERSAPVKVVWP